jgi:hypothetical protein
MPVLASVALLLTYGLAEGIWTNRWSLAPELARAPERLTAIPRVTGEWEGQEDKLDPRQARQAELRASLVRHYVRQRTGETLHVLLVCGRPGPVAVHAPEVCLGGAGFALRGKADRRTVTSPGLPAGTTFWVGEFHKPGAAVPEECELYWAWNSGSGWQAVDQPRLFFARERVLYKLYVSRETPGKTPAMEPAASAPTGPDPIGDFLKVFLPEVNAHLFPG